MIDEWRLEGVSQSLLVIVLIQSRQYFSDIIHHNLVKFFSIQVLYEQFRSSVILYVNRYEVFKPIEFVYDEPVLRYQQVLPFISALL